MQIKELNNDQNINRVLTKMSEDCSSQNNVNLTGCIENFNFVSNNSDNKEDVKLAYDHMYASNIDSLYLNNAESNCQNTESEVKFLKEWLLTHLDLIQQQNDDILNKEKTILILKQENEMLKERINCLDPNIVYQKDTLIKHSSNKHSCEEVVNEMTHDSTCVVDHNDSTIYIAQEQRGIEEPVYELGSSKYCSSQNELTQCETESVPIKKEVANINSELTHQTENLSDSTSYNIKNFTTNNSTEESLKNIKMSIRRKRLGSSSSALSNNEIGVEETHNNIKKKRKRKSSIRDDKILMSTEQYITQTGQFLSLLPREISCAVEATIASNLEVPRWRVKVYTSCYSMEGTENLDDEVYNKRHIRLENDERRRKRWDVQRIREQRIVEKLKQRQERIGSGSRIDEESESINSLWPPLEDIKYLEVCDHLPVSAFGAPIPRFQPMEFTLPWLSNPQAITDLNKKNSNRKSTIRRKATKR
ncbi:hypothetical protein FQR65_LT08425 [Abscondita terminalis]|nr:hypothetical protein FQR65_LT08425 [Abscondita terminalis]